MNDGIAVHVVAHWSRHSMLAPNQTTAAMAVVLEDRHRHGMTMQVLDHHCYLIKQGQVTTMNMVNAWQVCYFQQVDQK
jgi:hypothetical protein